MTTEHGYREAAVAALAEREYETAGDEYSRAGWARLAAPHDGRSPFDADERGWVGVAVQELLTGAIAYRVADRTERATRRCVESIAVARDLKTALDRPVQRACLTEIVADCRVVGGLEGADRAYRDAEEAYLEAGETVSEPARWATSPLFRAAAGPIKQVARGLADGEIAIGWEELHGSDPSRPGPFLSKRATYKRQRFPALLERVIEDGRLAAPRGTTAYGTDHECPRCGSADVNWVGGSTLCLRCSTPTERP